MPELVPRVGLIGLIVVTDKRATVSTPHRLAFVLLTFLSGSLGSDGLQMLEVLEIIPTGSTCIRLRSIAYI